MKDRTTDHPNKVQPQQQQPGQKPQPGSCDKNNPKNPNDKKGGGCGSCK
ncbi:MAG: hypothetical protein K2Y01_05190 [Rhabdochlamydiaceae bacterium]|nr:hypothetical protein [Rhabdochlamydiaceae bacterium]